MDTRAIWRDNPMRQTWSLHLVRGGRGAGLYEVAFASPNGMLTWATRDMAANHDDPPLLELPDWILREIVLPAAPGATQPAQAAGRVDALEEALSVERGRVDQVLAAAVGSLTPKVSDA
jgi:hypothetical protein